MENGKWKVENGQYCPLKGENGKLTISGKWKISGK